MSYVYPRHVFPLLCSSVLLVASGSVWVGYPIPRSSGGGGGKLELDNGPVGAGGRRVCFVPMVRMYGYGCYVWHGGPVAGWAAFTLAKIKVGSGQAGRSDRIDR